MVPVSTQPCTVCTHRTQPPTRSLCPVKPYTEPRSRHYTWPHALRPETIHQAQQPCSVSTHGTARGAGVREQRSLPDLAFPVSPPPFWLSLHSAPKIVTAHRVCTAQACVSSVRFPTCPVKPYTEPRSRHYTWPHALRPETIHQAQQPCSVSTHGTARGAGVREQRSLPDLAFPVSPPPFWLSLHSAPKIVTAHRVCTFSSCTVSRRPPSHSADRRKSNSLYPLVPHLHFIWPSPLKPPAPPPPSPCRGIRFRR